MKTVNANSYLAIRDHFRDQLKPEEKWVIDTVFNNEKKNYNSSSNNQAIEQYATSNGVGSLLYLNAKNTLPPDLTNKLKTATFRLLAQNTLIESTILKIQKLLSGANIPTLFIKGSILAFTRYKEAHYRPMSDIDLIIPEERSYETFQLLNRNGAIGNWKPMNESDHHLPQLSLDSAIIELHTKLFPPYAKYAALNNNIWENSYSWCKGNLSLPGLSVAHHALYIATHIFYNYKRGGLRLSWFYDLSVLTDDLQQLESNELNLFVSNNKLEEPASFIGIIYYCLTDKQLPNWPIDNHYKISQNEIKNIASSFRGGKQQNTDDSYQVILEQIRYAPNFKIKCRIIKDRITRDKSLNGTKLIKHIFIVSYRLIRSLIHQVRK